MNTKNIQSWFDKARDQPLAGRVKRPESISAADSNRRRRRTTQDSGYMSDSGSRSIVQGDPAIPKPLVVKQRSYTEAVQVNRYKAKKHSFIVRRAKITEGVLKSYSLPGKQHDFKRANLYAIVMPMGGGKTNFCDMYGVIDVDSCSQKLRGMIGVDAFMSELLAKLDWEKAMVPVAEEVNRTLDILQLRKPTLILVHDVTMCSNIGARHIGTVVVSEELHKKAIKEREPFQASLATMNRELVVKQPHIAVNTHSEATAAIVKLMVAHGIEVAAPCQHDWTDKAAGYNYQDADPMVLTGSSRDLDAMIQLHQNGVVPKVAVDYTCHKLGKKSYRGYGITVNDWASVFSGNELDSGEAKPGMGWRKLRDTLDVQDYEFDALVARLEKEPEQYTGYLMAHWHTIGRDCQEPEVIFRLYQIGELHWHRTIADVLKLLSVSNYFLDTEVHSSMRVTICELLHAVPCHSSGTLDTLRTSSSDGWLGPTSFSEDKSSLEKMASLIRITSELRFTQAKISLLRRKVGRMGDSACRDWLALHLDGLEEGSLSDILEQLKPAEIPSHVLFCCVLHHIEEELDLLTLYSELHNMAMLKDNHDEEMLHGVLKTLGKISDSESKTWCAAITTMLCSDGGSNMPMWRRLYINSVEEIISNASVCLVSTQLGKSASVMISRGANVSCQTSLSDQIEWARCLSKGKLPLMQMVGMSSVVRKEVICRRSLERLKQSKASAVADLLRAEKFGVKTQNCIIAHGYSIFGSSSAYIHVVNCLPPPAQYDKHSSKTLSKLEYVVYGDRKKGGYGYRKQGNLTYSIEQRINRDEKGNLDIKQFKPQSAPKLRRHKQVEKIMVGNVITDVIMDIPTSNRAISELGLEGAEVVTFLSGGNELQILDSII